MIRKVAGVFLLLFGLVLAGWIFYNVFIHTLPEAQGKSPIIPSLLAAGLIYVGIKWIKGEIAG